MRALPETENDGERNATLETAPMRSGDTSPNPQLGALQSSMKSESSIYCNNVVVRSSFTSTISNSWKLFLYTYSTGIIGLYAFRAGFKQNLQTLNGLQGFNLLHCFTTSVSILQTFSLMMTEPFSWNVGEVFRAYSKYNFQLSLLSALWEVTPTTTRIQDFH